MPHKSAGYFLKKKTFKLLLSPIFPKRFLKEYICEPNLFSLCKVNVSYSNVKVMFEHYGFEGAYIAIQAVLTLYAQVSQQKSELLV